MKKLSFVLVVIVSNVFAQGLNNVTFSVPNKNLNARIVGGSIAPNGAFPYQVSIRMWALNRHICGGSIIGHNWVLTAAHCLKGQFAASLAIVAGTNRLTSGGIAYFVSQTIIHEHYNPQNNKNDIAVCRTSSSINYNDKVGSISLATSTTPGGVSLIFSGWGLTSYPSVLLPNNLQYISLMSITVLQCQNVLPGFPVYNTNVCTLEPAGRGVCQGDSGGPLTWNGVQVGVASWGIPCAKGNPDVFASVASFREWIATKTGI